jgi:hypothetical protein
MKVALRAWQESERRIFDNRKCMNQFFPRASRSGRAEEIFDAADDHVGDRHASFACALACSFEQIRR